MTRKKGSTLPLMGVVFEGEAPQLREGLGGRAPQRRGLGGGASPQERDDKLQRVGGQIDLFITKSLKSGFSFSSKKNERDATSFQKFFLPSTLHFVPLRFPQTQRGSYKSDSWAHIL